MHINQIKSHIATFFGVLSLVTMFAGMFGAMVAGNDMKLHWIAAGLMMISLVFWAIWYLAGGNK